MEDEPRVGVFICHCGINIAGVIDIDEVVNHAKSLPNVVVATDSIFTCSAPGQSTIKENIQNQNLNRVVVAACSPQMHEPTFRKTVKEAGLNPYLFEMANIREHSSWVHPKEPKLATEKAKDIVRMAVAKVRLLEPLEIEKAKVTDKVLVVGGGIAGLKATVDVVERGFSVSLVEKLPSLGGNAIRIGNLAHTNRRGSEVVKQLINQIKDHPKVKIYTNSEITDVVGAYGDYKVQIQKNPRYVSVEYI
ncbi:MAG: FAD-dependent oxidoreductase [Candidatus Kariarchaeaceae archaeon]|jgi:heterodisulfide reductase subunit A